MSVLEAALMVAKAFRNVHALSSGLKALKVNRPPVVCQTRWASNVNVLRFYNLNWAYMSQIAVSSLRANDPVRQTLINHQLCKSILDLLTYFVPVTDALERSGGGRYGGMQCPEVCLGEAIHLWLSVLDKVSSMAIEDLCKKRAAQLLDFAPTRA